MIITHQLYFTVLTISSETKSKSEKFRAPSQTLGLGFSGVMRRWPSIHPPSESVSSPRLVAYRVVLCPDGGGGRLRQGEEAKEALHRRLVAFDPQIPGV